MTNIVVTTYIQVIQLNDYMYLYHNDLEYMCYILTTSEMFYLPNLQNTFL